jgi:hypothetical protein
MQILARASRLVSVVLALGVVLLTISCSDTDARLSTTGPSAVDSMSLEVKPTSTTAFAQPVSNARCPGVAPFNVAFGLSVRTTGWSSVIVTGIRAQFTDTSGVQSPQVTLPAPGPTPIFGNPNPSGSEHTFPLILGIGCGTGSRGTLIVIVDTSDGRGRRGAHQVAIAVG